MRNSPFNNCFIIPYHLLTGVNSWFPSYLQNFPPYRCICCWHACYQSIKSLVPSLLYKIWEMKIYHLLVTIAVIFIITSIIILIITFYYVELWHQICLSLHNYGLQNYSNQHKFFCKSRRYIGVSKFIIRCLLIRFVNRIYIRCLQFHHQESHNYVYDELGLLMGLIKWHWPIISN